jgi:hypothetical protein
LQDDDYWYLRNRARDEPTFNRVMCQNLTGWFHRTALERSQRGSVNTLWFGQQRGSKSFSLLEFTRRQDPTFAGQLSARLTFDLRTLEARLNQAQPRQYFMHDEIQKTALYGEGAKWTLDQISDFLETHAKTRVSIGFATPVRKFEGMLAGINFAVEIIGYNEARRFSMGLLRSHRNIEIGVVFSGHPPKPLVDTYGALKDVFLSGPQDEDAETAQYIAQMKHHPLWSVANSVQDFDTILWKQHRGMPTGLRAKIARDAYLQMRLEKLGVDHNGQPANVIIVQDDFISVLRQCTRNFLLRHGRVKNSEVVERWLLRYFEGKTHKAIAEAVGERRTDTVGDSIVELDARLSKTNKGQILEEALCLYLNAHTLPQPGATTRRATSPSTDLSPRSPRPWRRGGGSGDCDVAWPSLTAPRVAVNCKLFFEHRPSWELTVAPEPDQAPPGAAYLLLVTLSVPDGAQGPRVWRLPSHTLHVATASAEEVAWKDWLVELRSIIRKAGGEP